MPLSSIETAIDAVRRGGMVILVDDEDRENEGDLVLAADKVTPEAINFMAMHGRGLICLSLTEERLNQLQLPMMVEQNSSQFGTAFTVSIEAREGVTTGISAADRARTVEAAVAPGARPEDLVRPGHIFPLRARRGGVLVRTGQTEGSVDLSRLAGCDPSAVICEILNDDGTMARMPDLERFSATHDIPIVSIADLIRYRLEKDRLVSCVVETAYPCEASPDFRLRVYRDNLRGMEHLALVLGDPSASEEPVLVRVQHQATVGDVFRGTEVGCGWQLHGAMEAIADAGCGVLVYLQKGEESRLDAVRKHVLSADERAALDALVPERKIDVINQPKPEFRDFGLGAQIVADCGVTRMHVLSESKRQLVGLDAYGLEVIDRIDIPRPRYAR